jgi:hypothetical protein
MVLKYPLGLGDSADFEEMRLILSLMEYQRYKNVHISNDPVKDGTLYLVTEQPIDEKTLSGLNRIPGIKVFNPLTSASRLPGSWERGFRT